MTVAAPTPLLDAATKGDLACLQTLIQEAADQIDLPDPSSGKTPLMEAATYGHTACVVELLQAGADPTKRSTVGATARDYASSVELQTLLWQAESGEPDASLPADESAATVTDDATSAEAPAPDQEHVTAAYPEDQQQEYTYAQPQPDQQQSQDPHQQQPQQYAWPQAPVAGMVGAGAAPM
ncbi:hypothetical protein HK102_008932, partial [Quaeritorhiza haematococci]